MKAGRLGYLGVGTPLLRDIDVAERKQKMDSTERVESPCSQHAFAFVGRPWPEGGREYPCSSQCAPHGTVARVGCSGSVT